MRHVGLLTFIGFDKVIWRYKTIERDIRKDVLKIRIEAPTKEELLSTARQVMSVISVDSVHESLAVSDVEGMLNDLSRDIRSHDHQGITLEGEHVSVNWYSTTLDDRVCDVVIIK